MPEREAMPTAPARIAIVGQLPPPFGGISVHLNRLIDRLHQARVPYLFYDLLGRSEPTRNVVSGRRSAWWLGRFLLRTQERLIHLHSIRIPVLVASALTLGARGSGLVVTLHNDNPRRWYEGAGPAARRLWRSTVCAMRHIFCVNGELQAWLCELGVRPERTTHAPAFIPPTPKELHTAELPAGVEDFLHRHDPVIVSHGWFGEFRDGTHVYSFDMLSDLLPKLRSAWPRAGLITVVSGTHDRRHREEIRRRRESAGLRQDWLLTEQPFAAASLFARCDAFVRPTTTDGDSVSIRECLALGVPVIASDCVPRPASCALFRSRDPEAFAATVSEVLRRPEDFRSRARSEPVTDAADYVIRVYRDLLQTASH